MEWVFTLEKINQTAAELLQHIPSAGVVAVHGEMGAGKTSLIHAVCDVKNVKDVVGSPTFSIINEYAYDDNGIEKKIFHIDLYRLKDEKEAILAGVEDCFYSGAICLVEWPDRAPGIFPANTIHLYLDVVDDQTRKLKMNNK